MKNSFNKFAMLSEAYLILNTSSIQGAFRKRSCPGGLNVLFSDEESVWCCLESGFLQCRDLVVEETLL